MVFKVKGVCKCLRSKFKSISIKLLTVVNIRSAGFNSNKE